MPWIERAIAATSLFALALAGLLSLPTDGPLAEVSDTAFAVAGIEGGAAVLDPYRAVAADPATLSDLGRRYMAAVAPGNAATFAFYEAVAGGDWSKVRQACAAVVTGSQKSVALLRNGDPAWPRDLQQDVDAVVADTENASRTAGQCTASASMEAFAKIFHPTSDSGAADRVRVRLGLAPRPNV